MPLVDLVPVVEKKASEETAEEPLYSVIIHNDDVTPMDFVVRILKTIFKLSEHYATEIMYIAHHFGSAYVQSLPKAEAEKRVARAHAAASQSGYPLRFTLEPE